MPGSDNIPHRSPVVQSFIPDSTSFKWGCRPLLPTNNDARQVDRQGPRGCVGGFGTD